MLELFCGRTVLWGPDQCRSIKTAEIGPHQTSSFPPLPQTQLPANRLFGKKVYSRYLRSWCLASRGRCGCEIARLRRLAAAVAASFLRFLQWNGCEPACGQRGHCNFAMRFLCRIREGRAWAIPGRKGSYKSLFLLNSGHFSLENKGKFSSELWFA